MKNIFKWWKFRSHISYFYAMLTPSHFHLTIQHPSPFPIFKSISQTEYPTWRFCFKYSIWEIIFSWHFRISNAFKTIWRNMKVGSGLLNLSPMESTKNVWWKVWTKNRWCLRSSEIWKLLDGYFVCACGEMNKVYVKLSLHNLKVNWR